MSSRRVAMVTGFACATVACGALLGFGEDPPSDGLDLEAGADAPVVDASTADGGSTSTVDAARFCDGIDASYCEDFDTTDAGPDALAPTWVGFMQGGGVGYLIAAEGRSPPNAFAVEGTASHYAEGYVETMPVGSASVAIEFAVGIAAAPPPIVFVQVTWNEGGVRHGLSIQLDPAGGGSLTEIQGPVGDEAFTPLGAVSHPAWTSGWHDVVLEVDWTAKHVSLTIDATVTETATSMLPFFAGSLYVELGGTAFDRAAAPRRLLFDDLVVRAR